jgi:hypothetical protein
MQEIRPPWGETEVDSLAAPRVLTSGLHPHRWLSKYVQCVRTYFRLCCQLNADEVFGTPKVSISAYF